MKLEEFTIQQIFDIIYGLKDKRKDLEITMTKFKYLNNDLLDEKDRWIRNREKVDYWEIRKLLNDLKKILNQLDTVDIKI